VRDDLVPVPEEPSREVRAHPSEPDHPDPHPCLPPGPVALPL